MITSYILRYIVGALIIIGLVGGNIFYINKLKDEIVDKNKDITILENTLSIQTASIEAAAKDRKIIEADLKIATVENKKLSKEVLDLKRDIDKRPDAKTCEDAVVFLSNTASKIAYDWNSK